MAVDIEPHWSYAVKSSQHTINPQDAGAPPRAAPRPGQARPTAVAIEAHSWATTRLPGPVRDRGVAQRPVDVPGGPRRALACDLTVLARKHGAIEPLPRFSTTSCAVTSGSVRPARPPPRSEPRLRGGQDRRQARRQEARGRQGLRLHRPRPRATRASSTRATRSRSASTTRRPSSRCQAFTRSATRPTHYKGLEHTLLQQGLLLRRPDAARVAAARHRLRGPVASSPLRTSPAARAQADLQVEDNAKKQRLTLRGLMHERHGLREVRQDAATPRPSARARRRRWRLARSSRFSRVDALR